MKKWILVLLAVAAAAGGLYYWTVHSGVQPLHEKTLTFAEVKQTTIRDIVSATGVIEPREIVVVSSEMPGTIFSIAYREDKRPGPLDIGASVREGDALAQLDDRKFKLKIEEAKSGKAMADSALKQAEAALAHAEAKKEEADRYLKTQLQLEKSVGFKTEREQAEAQVQAAAAGIRLAKAGIDVSVAKQQAAATAEKEAALAHEMTLIKVPGNAKASKRREYLILDRKVNVGQMVGPQSGPMFVLAGSLDVVEVHAQVAEGDINKIGEGLAAVFRVNNYRDGESEFEGKVKNIRPQASSIKGAVYYDAVIEVHNRKEPSTGEWQLRPGMTASIDIVRHEHKDAWRVPSGALNFKLEEAYQTEAAKAHLAQWRNRADEKDWYPLWVFDKGTQQAQPVFVRVVARQGELGLKDSEGNEVLEWEPGKTPTGPLRVIIGAPPARPPSFFDQPANVKI